MDEPSQFGESLHDARALLPPADFVACESLNGHGERELALSHCRYHLEAFVHPLLETVRALVTPCELRFKAADA
jgi:hypothetical protein